MAVTVSEVVRLKSREVGRQREAGDEGVRQAGESPEGGCSTGTRKSRGARHIEETKWEPHPQEVLLVGQ